MFHDFPLLVLGLVIGWIATDAVRWLAARIVPERPELVVYGDVARVPEGFAAGSERFDAGGGGTAHTTRRVTRTKDHGSHSMMRRGV